MNPNRTIRRYGISLPVIIAFCITLTLYYWVEHVDHRLKLLGAVMRHASTLHQEQKVAKLQAAKERTRKQQAQAQESLTQSDTDSVSKNETHAGAGNNLWHSDDSGFGDYDCLQFPGADDVLVVIKTGATEMYKRLPVHLLTTMSCVQDFIVFSDMEQDLGDVHIYDALEPISDEWKKKDGHISKIYEQQKYFHSQGRDVDVVITEGAWEVDKWKNVPMAIKAYEMYPEKKWFMFMDADSTLLWSNLLLWIAQLDASKPQYYGAVTNVGNTRFAHGGTGYLVSRPALKIMVDRAPKKMAEWEDWTSHVCCGDAMFAGVLGTEPTHAYPLFNGGAPRSADYDSGHWCKAILTFHHLTPREVEELWRWEQQMLMKKVCQPVTLGKAGSHPCTGQKQPDHLRRPLSGLYGPLCAVWS